MLWVQALPVTGTTREGREQLQHIGVMNSYDLAEVVVQGFTEREGFEPSEEREPLAGLANQYIRPLCHLSRDGVSRR